MKKRQGFLSIELLFTIPVIIAMIVLFLNISGVVVKKIKLNNFTNEILRVAELEGVVGVQTMKTVDVMRDKLNIDPTIEWNTYEEVNLNDEISVICVLEFNLGIGNIVQTPITLSSKAVGRSEIYWKD